MKRTGKRWVSVLYAAVLVVLAAAGIIYCAMLKNGVDAEKQNQYAIERGTDISLDADAEGSLTLDEVETPAGAAE